MELNSIGYRIKQVQSHFGWNNVELAKAAGVSKQAVGKWLNLDALPSREALEQLKRSAGISEEWLLRGSGQMLSIPETGSLKELAGLWPLLSEEQKQSLLTVARLYARAQVENESNGRQGEAQMASAKALQANLARLMKEKGLSQAALSRSTLNQVSQKTVSNILSGTQIPTLDTVDALARALDVECSQLLGVNPDDYSEE